MKPFLLSSLKTALCLAIALVSISCGQRKAVSPDTEFSTWISAYSGGMLGTDATIRIVFGSPLSSLTDADGNPVTDMDRKDLDRLFSFSPALKGTARIVGDDTVEFIPDDGQLKPGTVYKANFRLGDAVNWIDTVSVLNNHVSDKLYYKTDHHWTTQAAFYVFREAAPSLGIEGEVGENFASYTVSDSFNGVLAAKSGVGLSEKETIEIYAPTQGDDDVVVSYVDEGHKTTTLYDSSKLETRDQYAVFLGGNSSVIDIKTVSPEKKRLLVIKDSFANCFIPFLTPYYREIVVVDPRYYSGTIGDIMDTYRITDALVLYSGNTFFTDNHLSGVLTGE